VGGSLSGPCGRLCKASGKYIYTPRCPPESVLLASVKGIFLMSSPSPAALKQLDRLNRSSPGFPDQLNDILCGEEYKQCAPNLQEGDSAWLVDYLNEVRCHIALTRSPLKPA